MNILFVTSEVHPLVKTGGLGDVSASLPAALARLGHQVRIVLPAYRQALSRIGPVRLVGHVHVRSRPVRILEGTLEGVTVWLVDSPKEFDRDNGPYQGPDGRDWPDNAKRYALFSQAAVELGMDRAGLHWRPDVVHCNDWQSGLVPALLSLERNRPGTLFTIHNLAYQGVFPRQTFVDLRLTQELWRIDGVEFYGDFSFIKGGIALADRVTTVSPTYADEIRTAEFGYGLEGLLNHRGDHVSGVLNGADYAVWDPSHDPHIPQRYSAQTLAAKGKNKRALQARFGLPETPDRPVIGMVGRLVEQKGIDLVLHALPELCNRPLQLVILGTGEPHFEQALKDFAASHPDCLGLLIGYDEELAHLVEAGSDLFLMPSRFEPCGLNQIYSLRYGTLPIVRRTGGLADTVLDASEEAVRNGTATGFVFEHANAEAIVWAVDQALALYAQPEAWRQVTTNAMGQDYSWERSAQQYLELYRQAASDAANPK